jgi:inner membrane protein
MPSFLAHAAPPLALIPAFSTPGLPRRLWVLGICCAMAPDLDVIGFRLGIRYEDVLGHRGLSHSLAFAALSALVLAYAVWPWREPPFSRLRIWLFLFLATASHGVLDTFTDGGLGVALLSPFDPTRYFAPFRPIEVSPFRAQSFLLRALPILRSEALWIGLPSLAAGLALLGLRKTCATREISAP